MCAHIVSVSINHNASSVLWRKSDEVLQMKEERERECSEEKKVVEVPDGQTHITLTLHTLMIKYDRQFDCIFSCVINSYKHMLQLFSFSIQC